MIWDFEDNGQEWIAASTNEERADWAEAAVERFREVCKGDNDLTAITDLIGNLGHLFDRLMATSEMRDEFEGGTFEECVSMALIHARERNLRKALRHYHIDVNNDSDPTG